MKYSSQRRCGFAADVFEVSSCLLTLLILALLQSPAIVLAELPGRDLGVDGEGYGLSFAMKSTTTAAFSFFNQSGHLKYAEYDETAQSGSELQTQTVDSTTSSVTYVQVDESLSIPSASALSFSAGLPHIFYFHGALNQLRHAYFNGASWQIAVIDSSSKAGPAPAVSRCGSDFCLSYLDRTNNDLRFARGQGSSWTTSTVDASSGVVGSMSRITTNPAGLPVIVYYDATNKRPKVASQNGNGSWTIEVISNNGLFWGRYPSIAVGSDNVIHISATRYKSSLSLADLSVHYAKKSGGGWSVGVVSDDYAGADTAIALDSSGRPIIAYRRLQYSAHHGNFSAVEYAVLQATGLWDKQVLVGRYGGGGAIDAIGEIEMERTNNGELFLAYSFSRSYPAAQVAYRLFGLGQEDGETPPQTPNVDTDGDGTADLYDEDDDNDGLSDSDEAVYGTNSLVADSDSDGVSDGQEVADGTDPRDPESSLVIFRNTLCSVVGSNKLTQASFELISKSDFPLEVTTTLYGSRGQVLKKTAAALRSRSRSKVLLSQKKRHEPTISMVCATHNGNTGDLSARLLRKVSKSVAQRSATPQTAIPMSDAKRGSQYVAYNPRTAPTPRKGKGAVGGKEKRKDLKQLEIINFEGRDGSGTLNFYTSEQVQIASTRQFIRARNKVSIAYSRYLKSTNATNAIIEWIPDDPKHNFYIRNLLNSVSTETGARISFIKAKNVDRNSLLYWIFQTGNSECSDCIASQNQYRK